MANIVLAHGAWSAAWAWKKMRPLLRAAGHEFYSPTYTGLGERAHLARPEVDLSTHVQDVLAVLEFEDLADVVLLGHSYGGMVATGVADRARDRVKQLIYLDAFVPDDGQSLFDLNEAGREPMRALANAGDGWRVPPNPTPADTPPEDVAWLNARRVDMPIRCFETPLTFHGGPLTLPRSYIYATRITPADTFGRFAARARSEPGWRYHEIDASHSPAVSAPDRLMAVLEGIVAG